MISNEQLELHARGIGAMKDFSIDEVIRLDKEGFHYRSQFIADAGEAHRLMVEFLKQNTQPEPQGPRPTDEELRELRGCFERILCVARSSGGRTVGNIELADRLIKAVLARWGRPAIELEGTK